MYTCQLLCVRLCNYRNAWSTNNLGIRIFRFSEFNSVFVHAKYTSNTAACYDNDFNMYLMYLEKKRFILLFT